MASPIRRLLKLAAPAMISTAIAVFLLLLIECGWRVSGRLRTGVWPVTRAEQGTRLVEKISKAYRRHPYYLVGGRPGATLEALGHEVSFTEAGHRGPSVALPKPANRYRVLCVGGSATFDLLAKNDAATWPSLLGKALANENVDVVNAGFPGWTTVENLISLELRDIDFAPDLVLVYVGLNDLQPASHEPFARDYAVGHGDFLPRVLGVEPVPLAFASRFVFVEWLLDTMSDGKPAAEGFSPAWKWEGGARKGIISDAAAEVFERNVRSIIAVAHAHGAKVLLVPQRVFPLAGNENDRRYLESWAPGLEGAGFDGSLARLSEVDYKLAREGLASVADPFGTATFSRDDFGDPMHFNASGSTKFAAEVAKAVREVRSATLEP